NIFLVIPITFYDKPNLNKGVVDSRISSEASGSEDMVVLGQGQSPVWSIMIQRQLGRNAGRNINPSLTLN
ncbi:hypothetical protein C0J52_22704, partial [Blattella germanica]